MTFRTFDCRPSLDPRNENFSASRLMGTLETGPPRSYVWGSYITLDQGREGACVGFAWAGELAARPIVVQGITDTVGLELYREAQTIDEWPGEAYSGTSVLAGAKVLAARGRVSSYWWTSDPAELARVVSRHGPAVAGISWWSSMYQPWRNSDGRHIIQSGHGRIVGGHAIMVVGYSVRLRSFLLHNSWGDDWGSRGRAWISHDDMAGLLANGGEACIPIRKAIK